jgi:hypothetical protein
VDLVANNMRPAPASPTMNSFAFWAIRSYFAFVLSLIVINSTSEYRLVRMDARVHRLMTSPTAITIDQVKSALSDVIKNQEEGPGAGVSFDFGDPYVRSMYVHYDPKSGAVTHWSMIAGTSDVVDTAQAEDGRATRKLLLRSVILSAIAFSPLPFLWLQRRASTRSIKITLRLICVVLALPSIGVALLEGISTAWDWGLL